MARLSQVSRLRWWYLIHRWSSLVCTLFLLLLCLTGLPLVFEDELRDWLNPEPPFPELPADTPHADIDGLVAQAQARYPAEVVRYVFFDDDAPQVMVGLAPRTDSPPTENHFVLFDARTGDVRQEVPSARARPADFIDVVTRLHTDLYLDLPGEIVMALMGVLFIAALVSGVVLYAPFMRHLDFGTVRLERRQRIAWLDLHNLLGITALGWLALVGITGVINDLAKPLTNLWRTTDVAGLVAAYRGRPAPAALSPAQAVHDTVSRALPDRMITSIIFPGAPFGTPNHFLVWSIGSSPLGSRLFVPALVEGESGRLEVVAPVPWYLSALHASRPLHFGDYGGLPLKILWALLDLVAIVVLISGLYLWATRHRPVRR